MSIDRCIYGFYIYLVQKIKKHEVGESQCTEFILDSVPCILYIHSWYIKYLKSGIFAQSCLTLCDPMDYSPPGSSVHGILQARILEWVAIPFSRGSSPPRDWTWVSYTAGRSLTIWATKWSPRILEWVAIPFLGVSCWPTDWTWVSCTAGRFFTFWATYGGWNLMNNALFEKGVFADVIKLRILRWDCPGLSRWAPDTITSIL